MRKADQARRCGPAHHGAGFGERMNVIDRALWYVESHFGGSVTLDDLAATLGVSRFHLSRTFTYAIGRSFTAYLRGRRLTEAARTLAAGAPDILSVALDAGYSSHEAFSRAFRAQFGLTPDEVRARRNIDQLELVEAIRMPDAKTIDIAAPEMREGEPLLLAGLQHFFRFEDRAGIPTLWQRFTPHIGSIPGEVPGMSYGVCGLASSAEESEGFDYFAGVAVRSLDDLPQDLVGLRIAGQRWAVFRHEDHVSAIGATCAAAAEWMAASGFKPADGTVQMVEVYDPAFNPRTGLGGCEIWMPVSR